mmetsp:Transcript_13503/g.41696  ORF Transcript_13503/g.41696 Transcript_13503/m.41696 type:complete len:255 (+) Transcript_13503:276-1040(+)
MSRDGRESRVAARAAEDADEARVGGHALPKRGREQPGGRGAPSHALPREVEAVLLFTRHVGDRDGFRTRGGPLGDETRHRLLTRPGGEGRGARGPRDEPEAMFRPGVGRSRKSPVAAGGAARDAGRGAGRVVIAARGFGHGRGDGERRRRRAGGRDARPRRVRGGQEAHDRGALRGRAQGGRSERRGRARRRLRVARGVLARVRAADRGRRLGQVARPGLRGGHPGAVVRRARRVRREGRARRAGRAVRGALLQ